MSGAEGENYVVSQGLYQEFDYRVKRWRLRCAHCNSFIREDSHNWPNLPHAESCPNAGRALRVLKTETIYDFVQ